jgi:hypothetical protein
MFLNPLLAFSGGMDRRGAAKSSAMKIVQDGPTGFDAFKNADRQNAFAPFPPKSHINFYRMLSICEYRRDSTSATGD